MKTEMSQRCAAELTKTTSCPLNLDKFVSMGVREWRDNLTFQYIVIICTIFKISQIFRIFISIDWYIVTSYFNLKSTPNLQSYPCN